MAVLDYNQDFETNILNERRQSKQIMLLGSAYHILGVVFIMVALGLWLFPVTNGDASVRIIKFCVSIALMGLAALSFTAPITRANSTNASFDRRSRQLKIIKCDHRGAISSVSRVSISEMAEVELMDNALTARDALGEQIVSLTDLDAKTENALRMALTGYCSTLR